MTDLVVVSCTGFSAPGLDVALVEDLGLRPTVRRVVVGFMGCFGAIIGLRTGAAMCCSDPDGVSPTVRPQLSWSPPECPWAKWAAGRWGG